MVDTDTRYVIDWCKATRLTVHVRGTDDRPVIEFKDKADRKICGFVEVRRRFNLVLTRGG